MMNHQSVVRSTAMCTPRFLNDYRKLCPADRHRLVSVVRETEAFEQGLPSTIKNQIRKIEGVDDRYNAWRIRLSDARRLVVTRAPLRLVRVGAHDVTDECQDNQRAYFRDIREEDCVPFCELASHTGMFQTVVDTTYSPLSADDFTPRWTYYLDQQQADVCAAIFDAVCRFEDDGVSRTHWIVGGPGTGKTAILLNLLDTLRNNPGYDLRIRWSESVIDHLQTAVPFDLSQFKEDDADLGGRKRRVLLVDYPVGLSGLRIMIQHDKIR